MYLVTKSYLYYFLRLLPTITTKCRIIQLLITHYWPKNSEMWVIYNLQVYIISFAFWTMVVWSLGICVFSWLFNHQIIWCISVRDTLNTKLSGGKWWSTNSLVCSFLCYLTVWCICKEFTKSYRSELQIASNSIAFWVLTMVVGNKGIWDFLKAVITTKRFGVRLHCRSYLHAFYNSHKFSFYLWYLLKELGKLIRYEGLMSRAEICRTLLP